MVEAAGVVQRYGTETGKLLFSSSAHDPEIATSATSSYLELTWPCPGLQKHCGQY